MLTGELFVEICEDVHFVFMCGESSSINLECGDFVGTETGGGDSVEVFSVFVTINSKFNFASLLPESNPFSD